MHHYEGCADGSNIVFIIMKFVDANGVSTNKDKKVIISCIINHETNIISLPKPLKQINIEGHWGKPPISSLTLAAR